MHSFSPHPSAERDVQRLFAETFRRQIAALEKGQQRYRIPQTRDLYERHPKMAYHFKPELFVQLGGATDFSFPDQKFTLLPGEVCIMPKGVPHGEFVRRTDTDFENLVVCFYNDTVAIHIAREALPGTPGVNDIYFYTTPFYNDLVEYLNRVSDLRFYAPRVSDTVIKGLLLAEFALLLALVEDLSPARYSDTDRVFQCQWLIRNNLEDPELSVESLAEALRCSARHLSKVFHHQTGERIIELISRLRLQSAVEALRSTQLSVKEIAGACGYSDANYFARVFRQSTGRSPQQYREEGQRTACSVEKEPKVVFYNREEYGFGLSPEMMAKAHVKSPE
ncbi:hypothetical protein DB347_12020 [Opitutaceae bacterium EW11]|nr:hypothetical protein DB347_12020 [Opitutaceae bacterium EW11]